MRGILLGFMTLLVLTPILTCAMPFCPLESAQASEPEPCHQSKDGQKSGLMLALDCMGVDLFQPDVQADVVQPGLSVDHVDFLWVTRASNYNALLTSGYFIRGPPFGASPPYLNSTDLYLTTQRLRV